MSIFLKSERQDSKVILLLSIIYIFLSIGALTMVYPLLLMLSGSVKGKLDAYEFDVVPQFLINDNILYKRYTEQKYNEKVDEYQVANKEFIRIFKKVEQIADLSYKTSCAYAFKGSIINSEEIISNLIYHLNQWKKHISKHGLLMLELHGVDPSICAENKFKTPTIAYEATHGYSCLLYTSPSPRD